METGCGALGDAIVPLKHPAQYHNEIFLACLCVSPAHEEWAQSRQLSHLIIALFLRLIVWQERHFSESSVLSNSSDVIGPKLGGGITLTVSYFAAKQCQHFNIN